MSEFIIINKEKYNVSKWKNIHPGGDVFTNYIGTDCTAVFNAYHNLNNSKINKIMSGLRLDNSENSVLSEIDKDYIELHRQFEQQGFYNINQIYYVKKIIFIFSLLMGTIYFNCINDVLSGSMFGLMIQQSAFLGHDIGHNAVLSDSTSYFNSKYKSIWAFVFGNVLFGVDGLNWSHNHNTHHQQCCVPGIDTQNDHLPFILYKKRELDITGYKLNFLQRQLLKIQWLYILPVLFTIGKINIMLDIDNMKTIKDKHYVRIIGILLHVAMWVYFSINSINKLKFIAAALFFNGMIHLQIILNHAFMPRTTTDEICDNGWIRSQVETTVNIKTSWYDDWFHGGLQYQIEHHLFPRIPRYNFRHVQPYVLNFCKKHDIKYNNITFREGIYTLINSLYVEARL